MAKNKTFKRNNGAVKAEKRRRAAARAQLKTTSQHFVPSQHSKIIATATDSNGKSMAVWHNAKAGQVILGPAC